MDAQANAHLTYHPMDATTLLCTISACFGIGTLVLYFVLSYESYQRRTPRDVDYFRVENPVRNEEEHKRACLVAAESVATYVSTYHRPYARGNMLYGFTWAPSSNFQIAELGMCNLCYLPVGEYAVAFVSCDHGQSICVRCAGRLNEPKCPYCRRYVQLIYFTGRATASRTPKATI